MRAAPACMGPTSSTSSSGIAIGCRHGSSGGICSATWRSSASIRVPTPGAGPPRHLVLCRRRHAGGGDRQPVRRAELALGRGRLGDRPDDRLAHLRLQRLRRDPDRRADQPWQLGRSAVRRQGTRDRDQRADPLDERDRGRSGLRDPDRHGQACARPAAPDGQGLIRLHRRHDPGRHPGWPRSSSSTRRGVRSSPRSSPTRLRRVRGFVAARVRRSTTASTSPSAAI